MINRRIWRAFVAAPLMLGALSGPGVNAMTPATAVIVPTDDHSAVAEDLAPGSAPAKLVADIDVTDDAVTAPQPAFVKQAVLETASPIDSNIDSKSIECVAKVIIHEAGYEPHRGQIAVAQVIRNRMKRFSTSACAVVKQPGQFFNVDAYNPSRDTARWSDAVAIAQDTLAGEGEEVAPGALFFHAASSRGSFVGSRPRVAQIGGHIFYR
jgi:spore germination cell wall hydrolase CwlJ-like protein